MIVPPSAIIPLVLSRSRMTWLPGGSSPSNPSRKPTTSQPSLSAASTTPRNTAFSPGQSPPLVRTPIRGFIFAIALSEQFLWIGQTTGSRPLIIQLPAALQKRRAFAESIRAAEEHYHKMTRIHGLLLALANHFRLTIRVQNQTLTRARRKAGFHSVDPHFAQKFVRIAKHVIESLPRSIERNLAFLLRHIEAETCLVHCVSSETRHVF